MAQRIQKIAVAAAVLQHDDVEVARAARGLGGGQFPQLRELPDVSPQRARILLTMARNWTAMAGLKERLRQLRREAETQHSAPT